jgi:putative SOS response-associated peptidase YedK
VAGSRRKQPYLVRLASGAPLALAGLWERWRSTAGDAIETFTIVTTAADGALKALHDRMPVAIAPADQDEWLASPNPSALLASRADEPLEIVPVGTRVNDVANDDPTLIAPLADEPIVR